MMMATSLSSTIAAATSSVLPCQNIISSSSTTTMSTANNTMALYACTRCNSRYPFDDLSDGEMLCKVYI